MLKISDDIFKVQQIVIKFLVKSGKTGVEIMPILNNMHGEVTMKKSAVRDGRKDVNDDLVYGQHTETRTPSIVEHVNQLLDSDHCLSIRDVAHKLSINCETIRLIVKDEELLLQKLCAKLVPKNLIVEKKKQRLDVSNYVRKH